MQSQWHQDEYSKIVTPEQTISALFCCPVLVGRDSHVIMSLHANRQRAAPLPFLTPCQQIPDSRVQATVSANDNTRCKNDRQNYNSEGRNSMKARQLSCAAWCTYFIRDTSLLSQYRVSDIAMRLLKGRKHSRLSKKKKNNLKSGTYAVSVNIGTTVAQEVERVAQ